MLMQKLNKMIYFNKANKDIQLLELIYSIAFWKIWINLSFWVRLFTKAPGKWNTIQ